jgi:hypothetical protein
VRIFAIDAQVQCMPVHWAALTAVQHSWKEPIRAFYNKLIQRTKFVSRKWGSCLPQDGGDYEVVGILLFYLILS